MAEQGIPKLNSLRQKWIGCQILADAFLAAAMALIMISLLHVLLGIALWWGSLIFAVIASLLLIMHRPWQISLFTLAAFLNKTYPALEESAELLIKPLTELTLLQKLQLTKVAIALVEIPSLPRQFTIRLKHMLLLAIAATVLTLGLFRVAQHRFLSGNSIYPQEPKSAHAEKILPQINAVDLSITPPFYTGKPVRHQGKFTILAEEGSIAGWRIKTNMAVNRVSLLFNDHELITLKTGTDKTTWVTQKTIDKPGFYQVSIAGKLSDLYQVVVIKDNPPTLHIKSPQQYTYIDAGEVPKAILNATAMDDYGISNAIIHATVAKGSGEAVKFKEYQIGFGISFQLHNTQYNLQHLFDLPKLDMEPGDELYFYVEATDNHQQKSRTDVFTVSIQDTAALLSMDGLINGVNVKPEYFRSQRQIIMDTEKLLKGQDSLSKDIFNNTCNNIGIDQKMLRLRYGKFLGEEEESGIGAAAGNTDLSKAENFNNAAMVLDAYTDKHDNAEDATFFEPAIKAQLKATLTEMWNAELRLRTYKPQEALPFEYKALRLLKDLQQKSRSYVAKTAYNPSPLKLDKRLTGDLSEIIKPVNKQEVKPTADEFEQLKTALQLLEQLKITHQYSSADKHILQLARQQLSVKASAQPGIYLMAISAMNRILSSIHPQVRDINEVERAMQKALPQSKQMPQINRVAPDMGLAQHYYQNLHISNKHK